MCDLWQSHVLPTEVPLGDDKAMKNGLAAFIIFGKRHGNVADNLGR